MLVHNPHIKGYTPFILTTQILRDPNLISSDKGAKYTKIEPRRYLKHLKMESSGFDLCRKSCWHDSEFRKVGFWLISLWKQKVTPKTSHLYAVKRIFRAYLDSDLIVGENLDKITTRGVQFLGRRLISWQCKK
ncbi:hypothetical protein Tco_0158971 [Tanacetum coccineum]